MIYLRTSLNSADKKIFTTSAQKLVLLTIEQVLLKLKETIEKEENLKFEQTNRENILKAKMNDGSKLIIAAFDKTKNKCLAMIDHQNVPGSIDKKTVHQKWRNKIDKIFDSSMKT